MRRAAATVFKSVRLPLIVCAGAALLYLGWVGFAGSMAAYQPDRLPRLETAALGPRILVVAPHPDDETLAAGGLIHQAIAEGRHVRVVLVTCGDGFRRILPRFRQRGNTDTAEAFVRMGRARMRESRDALAELGVPAGDVVSLGYPDGSIADLWDGDWQAEEGVRGANGHDRVDYPFAYRPGAAYLGSSLASDLAANVASFSPTAVIFPDGEDANTDHWALNAFTEVVLDETGYQGSRYTYLVHRGLFPFPWSYEPRSALLPPRTLLRTGQHWLAYPLEGDTVAVKERALDRFSSQRAAMEPFLAAFVRRNELLSTVPRPDTVVASGAPSSLDATEMPGIVVRDPAGDTLMRLANSGADVREVSLVSSPDRLWLGLRLQGRPAGSVTYRVGLRVVVPGAAETPRLDAEVKGGRAFARAIDEDDSPPLALTVSARGTRIWIGAPASLLASGTECLIAAETRVGPTLVDRTAWRPVTLR